ncbi:hypothetical protein PISMIDRAFT_683895 [Pisolithus microcarpus 441]|uniref:Uncharacterized protein n=1 Tax=Pisolithus microcarpus 441 TaxID=765257 RepID=A0A0C9ZFW2_9AGAM|nr:hypothetical protein PISMIDRAFT_690268 [Pisolithus microcarpus 441]KIK18838.1 hypothetical protein PISMIDRAFT_683895 [Pisolithus microcarpus 441]
MYIITKNYQPKANGNVVLPSKKRAIHLLGTQVCCIAHSKVTAYCELAPQHFGRPFCIYQTTGNFYVRFMYVKYSLNRAPPHLALAVVLPNCGR